MAGMARHWMVAVPEARYRGERLYQRDSLDIPLASAIGPAAGDEVVLVAPDTQAGAAVVFGLGRVLANSGASLAVGYTRRLIDAPLPVGDAGLAAEADHAAAGPVLLPADRHAALAARLGPAPDPVAPRPEWMVSLNLPIEAASPAEAVRVFWTYVRSLGPAELPAFVWPRGDEYAMRPFVLGAEHEMDPEEEDDELPPS